MRCPTLSELPPPPSGKAGWPWTEESAQLPETLPDGSFWLPISIVTPSYNQALFLEESIRSVLLQGYPNLEYIIIDGGSTDGSIEILQKYVPWLTYWISEPDSGQSEALNKGFKHSTGSVIAWINSDDYYLPGVFPERVIEFIYNPELVMVYGDCYRVNEIGERINAWQTRQTTAFSLLMDGNQIPQQSAFIRASALNAVGGVDHKLNYVMDYALWLRLSLLGEFKYLSGPAANFRKHTTSKGLTAGYAFFEEWLNWLVEWNELALTLSESDQAEMFRRQHVVAALYAVFEGKERAAVSHFSRSLQDRIWPYGDVDNLTQVIIHFGGMGGHTMADSWGRYKALHRVLQRVEPGSLSHPLWQYIKSNFQVKRKSQGILGRIVEKIKSIVARILY